MTGQPSEWLDGLFPLDNIKDGFCKKFIKGTGQWNFACIVNSDLEIKMFFEKILPEISEEVIHTS